MSLYGVKSELSRIIAELERIERGLRTEFEGIGSEVAAARIRDFIQDCERARWALNRVNPSNRTQAYLQSKGW